MELELGQEKLTELRSTINIIHQKFPEELWKIVWRDQVEELIKIRVTEWKLKTKGTKAIAIYAKKWF